MNERIKPLTGVSLDHERDESLGVKTFPLARDVGMDKKLTELEAYRRRLEIDLKIAERVHRSMIPRDERRGDLEIVCDFAPMIGVGGDYASVHFQDDRHVVAGICDVSGHGIAAALLASRVNSFVLNIAPSVRHPCEVAEALNGFIHENSTPFWLWPSTCPAFLQKEKQHYSTEFGKYINWPIRRLIANVLNATNPL